jgi:hypothetical protein
LAWYPWGIWIEPDDANGLNSSKLCGPEEVIRLYSGWIVQQGQSNNVPPELLATVLLTELRAYNLGDTLFDNFGTEKQIVNHSVGIAQLDAHDVYSHGYLTEYKTEWDLKNALERPKTAIAILAQEIDYWGENDGWLLARGGLAVAWANGDESERERIVRGMCGAKDQDKFTPGSPFGDQGVDAWGIVKQRKLLQEQ